MNKQLVFILISLLSCGGYAHGGKNPWSLSGIVSGGRIGVGIEGAVISIEKNGQVLQTTHTDQEGKFAIKFEGSVSRMDHLKIKVYKKGYKTETYLPMNCKDNNLEITLARSIPVPIIRSSRTEPVFSI